MCRLDNRIKKGLIALCYNLKTNLSDTWLGTVSNNSSQTCWKLSKNKTFNKYLCNISGNIQIKL